jgi:hypothetical protein
MIGPKAGNNPDDVQTLKLVYWIGGLGRSETIGGRRT